MWSACTSHGGPVVVTPATPPPYRHLDAMTRMSPSASLYGRTACSGQRSGALALEAGACVGVQGPYARFCKWTSENLPSTHFGDYEQEEERPGQIPPL